MSDLPSPSAPSGDGDTPLEAAMYVADAIRQHINIPQVEPQSDSSAPHNSSSSSSSSSSTQSSSPSLSARLFDPPATTPGLAVGITAGVATFGLLTPVRKILLQAAGKQLHIIADLIVTSSQAVASANVAMYTGALTGSQVYLKLFNNISPTAPSITADSICNEPRILSYLQSHRQSDSTASSVSVPAAAAAVADDSGWDPRVQLAIELQQALKHCQQRNEWQQRSKQDISTTEQQEQQQQQEDHSATKMSWWKSR
jgi:hypothetical protein